MKYLRFINSLLHHHITNYSLHLAYSWKNNEKSTLLSCVYFPERNFDHLYVCCWFQFNRKTLVHLWWIWKKSNHLLIVLEYIMNLLINIHKQWRWLRNSSFIVGRCGYLQYTFRNRWLPILRFPRINIKSDITLT